MPKIIYNRFKIPTYLIECEKTSKENIEKGKESSANVAKQMSRRI